MECFYQDNTKPSILIDLMTQAECEAYVSSSSELKSAWLSSSNRAVTAGSHYLIPNQEGKLSQVLMVTEAGATIWSIADLPWLLPAGDYHLANTLSQELRHQLALGWGMGAYRYTRYQKEAKQCARLYLPDDIDIDAISIEIDAVSLTRDLINAPGNDMMTADLAAAAKQVAKAHAAEFSEIVGDELLAKNYPLIHAVGRASVHPPRLLKFSWGETTDPLLTIVGKGVCFDSGGLNIKPAASMRWMKKDMGGAAHALGLAQFVMQMKLPVRLNVLIPTVENAISGDAYRPGDVITSRLGKTVEIDNTDAEGRLILADALAEACEQSPDLIIDFATLTGAARVALGTEIGVFYSKSDRTAHGLYNAAKKSSDDIWRLPLHTGYKHELKSTIADLVNCPSSPFGGSIVAALFLESFVTEDCDWVHFDMMAYNMRDRPGRPKGGEAMGLRAVCEYLKTRYSK
jgi:leucyl aminopeptidase